MPRHFGDSGISGSFSKRNLTMTRKIPRKGSRPTATARKKLSGLPNLYEVQGRRDTSGPKTPQNKPSPKTNSLVEPRGNSQRRSFPLLRLQKSADAETRSVSFPRTSPDETSNKFPDEFIKVELDKLSLSSKDDADKYKRKRLFSNLGINFSGDGKPRRRPKSGTKVSSDGAKRNSIQLLEKYKNMNLAKVREEAEKRDPLEKQLDVEGMRRYSVIKKEKIDPNESQLKPAEANNAKRRNPEVADAAGTKQNQQGQSRFRKIARMIKTNFRWAREFRDKHEEDDSCVFVDRSKGDEEALTFDASNFKARSRTYGGMTSRARKILLKNPLDRTNEDLLVLREVVDRLKCFEKYSKKVKQELARVICYENFDDGRVIIQQGHIGLSFYFIISGAVIVKIAETDKNTGQTHGQILGELTEGSSFGELALLHDIKRTATIICKGSSEFLRLDKPDFDMVLKVSYELEWQERLTALRQIPTFSQWTTMELANCTHTSKVQEYPPNTVIFGNDNDSAPEYVHFVLTGECLIVRSFVMTKEGNGWGRYKTKLADNQEEYRRVNMSSDTTPSRRHQRRVRRSTVTALLERHVLSICKLTRGHYFGTGEDLRGSYIITSTDKVELLLVPRVMFLRSGRSKVLDDMKRRFQETIPTDSAAFAYYKSQEDWDKYKNDVVMDVVQKRKKREAAKLTDVPSVIRMNARPKGTRFSFQSAM